MTASTPRREPGGQPQRIFINAGKVVDRPPTLFRMPTVKKHSAVHSATEPAATGTAASPPAEPSLQTSPHPHTADFSSAATATTEPHFHTAHSSGNPGASPLPQTAPATEAPLEKSSRLQRAAASLPMPAERTWMETLGSRLVLLLLIAAVAAIAFLANRGGGGPADPDATFVGLDLESLEKAPAAANSSQAAAPTASAVEAPSLAKPQMAPEPISGAEAFAGVNRTDSRTDSRTTAVATDSRGLGSAVANGETAKATVPDFDLTELHASGPQPSSHLAATSTAEAAAPGAAPRSETAPSDSLAAESRATDSRATDSQATDQRRPATEAISAEDAILAAVDAAVAAPNESTSEPGTGYATTEQPAGVPDWSQYLPSGEATTPPSLGAGASHGQHTSSGPNAPFDSMPSDYPTGDSLPSAPSGRNDARYATGADAPDARTAINPYSANAASWDRGYPTPQGAATAAPQSTRPEEGFPAWNSQQGNFQHGNPQHGNPQQGNPQQGSVQYGTAQQGTQGMYDIDFPATR